MKDSIDLELLKTIDTLNNILKNSHLKSKIYEVANICINALKSGNKIMFCGNGGSAADSQHLAAELVARFNYDRPGLYAIALTTDTSALTAIGNDYGYEFLFSRQIEAIGKSGDILFGFSTSGKSINIIRAFERANNKKIITIGMLGIDGRDIGNIALHCINIPSSETPKIQECHITIGHIICNIIEQNIFPK